tara:strand:+ start:29360 stop:29803 length:444 start_codon:yes stop_codon:yes gene_type:complete
MSEETTSTQKKPKWLLGISIFALIWNLLGVFAYVAQMMMTPEMLAQLPADQQALMESTPAWATSAFALAVWGGSLGAILLLLKKKIAKLVFIVSLVGVLVQMFYNFVIANSIEVYGPGGLIMPIMVLIVSVGLVWYSNKAEKKGWLS